MISDTIINQICHTEDAVALIGRTYLGLLTEKNGMLCEVEGSGYERIPATFGTVLSFPECSSWQGYIAHAIGAFYTKDDRGEKPIVFHFLRCNVALTMGDRLELPPGFLDLS